MPQSPAQARASAKYEKKTYEHINLRVRRDAEINLAVIREHAAAHDETVGCFIRRAIAEAIQRDNASAE